ncbi:MAG: hypothetical protein ACPLTP_03955 [Thermotoga caldifontis]|uniref:hypothetical protein n=1 Tax=Thermotoga caldifontis TaxID=1508419 RepID=UPI003C7AEFE4
MLPLHLFLGHVVADHAFTNNAKIRTYRGSKLLGHIIWSLFAILAFTFDTFLRSRLGTVLLIAFFTVHALLDIVRVKVYPKGNLLNLVELVGLASALVFNIVGVRLLKGSYLSNEFVLYLLGMSVVSTGVTYFFRNFYPKDEFMSDIEGISERLAVFIFLLASKPLFVFLSLLIALFYRLIFVKRFDHTWWISPVSGLLISFAWRLMLYG